MTKVEQLNAKMYKLLVNHPYNVVRSECDRIGRQIQELSQKTKREVQA